MILFTGNDARAHEQKVLALLESYLDTRLKVAPYTATFAKWHGVAVTQDDEAAMKHFNAKKPFLFLSIGDGEHRRKPRDYPVDATNPGSVLQRGEEHSITVTAEIITSDFSGNKIGASNLVSSTQLLRDALQYLTQTRRADLAAIGLYHGSCEPDKNRWMNPNLFNPHRLRFTTHTINPAP